MTEKEKIEKLKEFIATLSESEVRHELLLSYLMMERCQEVMEGKNVDPVKMKENGLDSDLELFYMCKKLKVEHDSLEGIRDNAAQAVSQAITAISDVMKELKDLKVDMEDKIAKLNAIINKQ